MNPVEFLESGDPAKTIVMLATANYWAKMRKELDQALAAEIINTLARSMKGGGGRGATGAY